MHFTSKFNGPGNDNKKEWMFLSFLAHDKIKTQKSQTLSYNTLIFKETNVKGN